ncbi:MAG: TolC family protein [Acidobacteria bacterium]|nr:TolC family protein [Acidobacteriota bacterium]
MKPRHGWIITLALACSGQEGRPMPLSLSKAIEIATAPNGAVRVQMAAELTTQAEARRKQSLSALLPNVSGNYTFRSFTNNVAALGIQFPTVPGFTFNSLLGPVEVNDVRANATQSIFDLAAIRRYQASKVQLQAAKSDASAAHNQVKGAVAKAYLNATRAESTVTTAKANVALAERVLRLAQSQKDAGTGTGIEITRAQVSLANERQNLLKATEDQTNSVLLLLRAMNLDLDVVPDLTDKLRYVPADVPEPRQALTAAKELRPELRAQAQREQAAKLNYDSSKWERLPSITAFGDYGTIGAVDGALLPTRSVGASVRIPLWDGGRMDSRRAESASQLRQEGIRTRDTAQQVELEIRTSLEALKTAESLVAVAREALAQSEKELAQAERRFSAGVANGLEVTEAQTRVARGRENEVASVFRQQSARIDLGLAVGNIDMILQ